MVYGPFDLSDATDARVTFRYWLDVEAGYDSLFYGASGDNADYNGYSMAGYDRTWYSATFSLNDYLGDDSVWFTFVFQSDYMVQYEGAYVDDVVIEKYASGGMPDLVVESSSCTPLTVTPGEPVTLVNTVRNIGSAATPNEFWVTWYISTDPTMSTSDSMWAWYRSPVLAPGAASGGSAGIAWPDEAPFNQPGTYYVAVMADDYLEVSESDESNNWGQVFEVTVGDIEPGEIRGSKWNDLNGDGNWDGTEPGLAGWQIYLDQNLDGQWDPNEPQQLTDPNGDYAFIGLEPGAYVVAEVPQDDWEQTFPGAGWTAPMAASAGRTTYGDAMSGEELSKIKVVIMDSPPTRPSGIGVQAAFAIPQAAVMLPEVPTSTWTYGCSATSAGMMFGYYDRTGYPHMYAGPTNGGIAPLADLGQGDDPGNPIPGSCYIIATQNGHDGRTARGHVDDYWDYYSYSGVDPWERNGWVEHLWELCTADFMGTNQWKWDIDPWPDGDGERDINVDGSTILVWNTDGSRLYDFVPPESWGMPQTALDHGMRLFAESRGYTVVENYTQLVDPPTSGGFTFADYMNEIDLGRPVMIQVEGHSMVGIGYEEASQTVYLHDTWDNGVHTMTWGDSYAGMAHQAVTVIRLAPAGTHTVVVDSGEIETGWNFGNHYAGAAAIVSWDIGVSHGQTDLCCAIPYDPNASGYPYVEAGTSGIQRLRVWFDQAMDVSATDPSLISIVGVRNGPQATPCSVTWDGDTCMVINLCAALPDQDMYTVTVAAEVTSAGGGPLGGDRDVCLAALVGDANGNLDVTSGDLLAIRAHINESLDCSNARYDINGNGSITSGDLLAARAKIGNDAPPCP